jgi:hypothetical protein
LGRRAEIEEEGLGFEIDGTESSVESVVGDLLLVMCKSTVCGQPFAQRRTDHCGQVTMTHFVSSVDDHWNFAQLGYARKLV